MDDDLANLDKIVIIDKIGDNAKILYDNNFKPVYHFQHNQLNELFKSREKIYKNFKFLYNFIKKLFSIFENIKDLIVQVYTSKKFKLPEKIIEYDHHLSHAASFCYFKEYNNEKYLVFTMDGEGDHKSSTVNILEKNNFKEISQNSSQVSLGYFYLYLTFYLGLKANEHEFKVMGLAPYADKKRSDLIKEDLSKLIWIDEKVISAPRFLVVVLFLS